MSRNTHDREEEHVGPLPGVYVELAEALSASLPAGATVEDAIRVIHERLLALEDADIVLGHFRGDAWIRALGFTGDAVIQRPRKGSFTGGAWVGPDKGIIADAIILRVREGSFLGDAVITEPGEIEEVELSHVERATSLTVTATDYLSPQVLLTAAELTFDGSTRVCIELFIPDWRPASGAASRYIAAHLWDGETEIGQLAINRTPSSGLDNKTALARRFLTPSAGAHTYSVRCYISSGTGGLISAGSGTADQGDPVPAYLRIFEAPPAA